MSRADDERTREKFADPAAWTPDTTTGDLNRDLIGATGVTIVTPGNGFYQVIVRR
jgi:hypothetical protein